MARGKIGVIDWIMLLLAVLSVAMLVYETWGDPTPEQTKQILLADYVIIAIFAVEFLLRWARNEWKLGFLGRNWYEILGMIPVAHPAIRGFRLFRIIRIAVILSRFGRAADRAFGDEFTYRIMRRFKNSIADAVSGAVTARVLDETMAVMMKAEFMENMADAIEEHGDSMLDIAVEKVANDPQVGRVRNVPFFDDIVRASSRVTQRIVIDLLRDDRMEELTRNIIAQNVGQIKAAIAEKDA